MPKYIISFRYELETDSAMPEIFFSSPGSARVLSTVQFINTLLDLEGLDKITHADIQFYPIVELDEPEEVPPELADWAQPSEEVVWPTTWAVEKVNID